MSNQNYQVSSSLMKILSINLSMESSRNIYTKIFPLIKWSLSLNLNLKTQIWYCKQRSTIHKSLMQIPQDQILMHKAVRRKKTKNPYPFKKVNSSKRLSSKRAIHTYPRHGIKDSSYLLLPKHYMDLNRFKEALVE